MNSYKRLRLFGSGGVSPPTSLQHGFNVAPSEYFTSCNPYINMFLGGAQMEIHTDAGGTAAINADGWVTNLSNNGYCEFPVALALDANQGSLPPGNYVFKSTSTATLGVKASPGISAVVPGVGSCTFTVTALPGAWNTIDFRPTFTNNTGGTINILNAYVCLASEESLLLGGKMLRPWFSTDYAGASAFRAMDIMNTNGAARIRKFSEYGSQSLTKASYGLGNTGNVCNLPWAALGLIAKELNVPLWVCLPMGDGQTYFTVTRATSTFQKSDAAGTTFYPHGFVANERVRMIGPATVPGAAPMVVETTYFVIVTDSTHFKLSLTSGGAAVTITAGSDSLPADNNFAAIGSLDVTPLVDLYQPIANAIYAAAPNIRVIVELANEIWNPSFPQFGCAYLLYGVIATGVRDPQWGQAWGQLQAWKAFENVFPVAQVTVAMCGQDGLLASGRLLTFVDPGFISAGQTVAQIMNARADRAVYAVAQYFNADDGAGHDGPGSFTPATMYALNGNSTAVPDSLWDTVFNRGIAACAARVGFNATVRSAIPTVPFGMYEGGHQFFWIGSTDTNAQAIGLNLQAYFDSNAGLGVYQRWYTQCVQANLMSKYLMVYEGPGTYSATANIVSCWGIKKAYAADTPRSAFIKGL